MNKSKFSNSKRKRNQYEENSNFFVFLLTFTFFMIGVSAKGQEFKVTGKILGEEGADAGYATVTLRSLPDSLLVRGISADSAGSFVLNGIVSGTYVLDIRSIGLLAHQEKIEILNRDLHLPLIRLKIDPNQHALENVIVTGQKPFLKQEIDKLVVDIENSIYSRGENAMRLFNVIPGMQTDAFGNILYRGTESVTVYVDNIKVQLTGQQLANYLRSIRSESIKSYEIRSIGGVQYDADNTGTVINIILKNDYHYGLTGNIGAEYQYTKYSNSSVYSSLNYTVGKFTFQANGSLYDGKQFEDQEEVQSYKTSGIQSFQEHNTLTDAFFGNYKVGLDYRVALNQTFTANFERTSFPYHPSTISNNIFSMDNLLSIDSVVNTRNKKDIKQNTSQVNFIYRNKLDTLGSRLDLGYSYIDYDNKYDSEIATSYSYPKNANGDYFEDLFVDNPLTIKIHTANIDLEKIIPNSMVLNLGAKYNSSTTNNDISYFSTAPGGDLSIDKLRSNRYKYDEQILAFYSSLAKDWDKWSFKIGLRMENTNYKGFSITNQENVSFDKWSLFPSLFIQNKINESNSLALSYSRSINRPSYRLLNSFENIQNPFYIETGNPFLLPYFTHKAELSYLLNSKYNFTVGYDNTADGINNIYLNEGPVIISTYANINDSESLFLSTGIPFKVANWWEINTSITLRYTKLSIHIPEFFRVKEKFSQDFWISNRFKVDNDFFIEMNARYGRNHFLGIYEWKPQGNIDFNFKKSFMDDKLALNLNFSDPFNLRKIGWKVEELEFNRDVNYSLPARFVSVGLSYNFSKGKKTVDRENTSVPDGDERGRLN